MPLGPQLTPSLWAKYESSMDAALDAELEPRPPITADQEGEATNWTSATKPTHLRMKWKRGTQHRKEQQKGQGT